MQFSIIKKSQLEGAKRLDAEYYQPGYFIDFTKGQWKSVGDCLEVCQYGISKAMNEEKIGYPIFKMDDIDYGFLFDDKIRFIDINDKVFKEYKLAKNDILFNRVNSEEFVGRTGIFKLDLPSVFASYLIRLRLEGKSGILPDYFNIFLNSKYGKKQINKFSRRAVNQANVNAEELKRFKIAILPTEDQKIIKDLSDESWSNFELSKTLYQQAENLLLDELGLADFKIDDELSNVVNLSDVKAAHRLDAEFFQIKYETIFKKVKTPLKTLNEITTFLNHAKQPPYVDGGDIPIVTQKHLGSSFLNLEALDEPETKHTSKQWLDENKVYKLKHGDVLYYSVGAYIGKTNVVLQNLNATSASFITIIRLKESVNPIYLTVVLNSIVGKLQSEKWQSATAQSYIYPKDIKNFKIPILPKSTQQKIANLVQESFDARARAEHLLEQAKRKAEEFIEKGGEHD